MKNINNIYKVLILKITGSIQSNILRFSKEAIMFIKEKGFEIIALHNLLFDGTSSDIIINEFMNNE